MAEMGRILYHFSSFLHLGKWLSGGFLQLLSWPETGRSDLPSTFLFVMEALSKMIEGMVDGGLLHGFSVGNGDLNISHLLFVDATLIFCGAHLGQVQDLRALLLCFAVVSRLSINLAKSKIVPVGATPDVEIFASTIGCKISSLLMKYLGLPLGASFKSERIWNDVVERVECRLAAWKRLYLSKGGRLTLIKSTLSNLTTYFLSLFPLSTKVANRIEKLQRDFLWSELGEEFKFHQVNWSTVCTPISGGGLGIRHLLKFNQALLDKWLWRYQNEREAFWRAVIDSQFGEAWRGWCSNEVQGTYGVGLWKNIMSLWGTF
ncbi:uncharacterized protein LOC121261047 [Juglans microcarpa x Juglans regia]|uniref:uncharacterized protein LOC121261047 n=1 Tax=Juglans microcarpa x Juglans regia TaxID=2249226 RepID=UPI001B7F779A|nr:uncharacterized protein LOC121261047 [Juglans microcarpa x Juglans regia]